MYSFCFVSGYTKSQLPLRKKVYRDPVSDHNKHFDMLSVLSKFVIQTLCENQGRLDFSSLDEKIRKAFAVPFEEQDLRKVLFDDGRIAIRKGKQTLPGCPITCRDSVIVAKTSLRLCQKRTGGCSQCDSLHLCRYYVCGNCTFGHKCKNPHSLASPYNAELLKKCDLQHLTEKQLFQLLLQNDPSLLPEVCPHYNKGTGVHGSCKFTTSCTKLHVCQHYFIGDCRFGSSCKRVHKIDVNGLKAFQSFSEENIRNLLQVYRNKSIIMGQHGRQAIAVPALPSPAQLPSHSNPTTSVEITKATSDAERNEICLFYVHKHCSFKERCVRVHYHLPYRWQVLDSDGVNWKDFPKMEEIEKAYCDPGNDTSCVDQPSPSSAIRRFLALSLSSSDEPSVDFMKMTYEGTQVRRLSTVSSVLKPSSFTLTTEWLWYWKDENGIWLEFGQSTGTTPASFTSQTLEGVFLADRDTAVTFSAGKHQYILNFKDAAGNQQMFQENIKYKTKREVRRRPKFVSAQEVEVILKGASSGSGSSSTAQSYPSYWEKSALPDCGYKLVLLSGSAEYNMIKSLFAKTMPQGKISSIKRIQNPSLWEGFQWQKEQMKKRSKGAPVKEEYLFHGTDESLIDSICDQNFDWRMCGVHGTAYGRGSYFAKDSSYSDRYARAKGSQNKIMFVALVLVGEYTRGRSAYTRPPPKDGSTSLYDSCVDSESNPGIYVIFEKQQIYPEYLIHYS